MEYPTGEACAQFAMVGHDGPHQKQNPPTCAPSTESPVENIPHANNVEQLQSLIETSNVLSFAERMALWAKQDQADKGLQHDVSKKEVPAPSLYAGKSILEQEPATQQKVDTAKEPPPSGQHKEKTHQDKETSSAKVSNVNVHIRREDDVSIPASKWEFLLRKATEVGKRRAHLEQQVKDLQHTLEDQHQKMNQQAEEMTGALTTIQSLQREVQDKDAMILALQAKINVLQHVSTSPDVLVQNGVGSIVHPNSKKANLSSTQKPQNDDLPSLEPVDDTISTSFTSSEGTPEDYLNFDRDPEVQILTMQPGDCYNIAEETVPRDADSYRSPQEDSSCVSPDDEKDIFKNPEVQEILLVHEEEKDRLQETLKISQEHIQELEHQLQMTRQELHLAQQHGFQPADLPTTIPRTSTSFEVTEVDALDYMRELEAQITMQQQDRTNNPLEEQDCFHDMDSCSDLDFTLEPCGDEEIDIFKNKEVQEVLMALEEEKDRLQELLEVSQQRMQQVESQLQEAQKVQIMQVQQQEDKSTANANSDESSSWQADRKSLENLVIQQKRALLDAHAAMEAIRVQNSKTKQLQQNSTVLKAEPSKWRFPSLVPVPLQECEESHQQEPEQEPSKESDEQVVNEDEEAATTTAQWLRKKLEMEKVLRQSMELENKRFESEITETQQTLETLQEELEKERASHVTAMTQLQEEVTCLRGSNEYHKESLEVLKEALREVSLELAASRESQVVNHEKESNDEEDHDDVVVQCT
eukprot:Nitzschia sp. Nitz4//scaffold118_size93875//51410//53674//NITZ4_004791-RA/size93875-processed-gene-0.36-mRNA-1//1//CDS//3329533733//4978//frame0